MSLIRTFIWQSAVLVGAGSNAGCRVVQCVPDASSSTIATQTVAGHRLSVYGRVLAIETGTPVLSARVQLASESVWTPVDSTGAASIATDTPGSLTLSVAAPGYAASSRIITVRGDSGVAWVALLARSRSIRRDPACGADSATDATRSP